jgi:predicted HAD superfamily Cof-like phosphohydrolase
MVKMHYTNFDKVAEFMKAFGQEVNTTPQRLDESTEMLRLRLIHEEMLEVKEAIHYEGLPEIAKELCDLLYVVYGMGHSMGIDLNACFNVVHESNMSKLGIDGKPIYREDGKVLKGPNYFEADLLPVLANA